MTVYDFCLERNMRILDLEEDKEVDYYLIQKTEAECLDFVSKHTIKPNSMPRKPERFLELRMYGFVPYNLSDIQKGIQFGHAVVRYSREHNGDEYSNFADLWETFIILNGGTTNEGTNMRHGYKNIDYTGSMQVLFKEFIDNNVMVSAFREPDANNALTAFVFLVDERVFDKVLYPDFKSHPYPWLEKSRRRNPTDKEMSEWEEINDKNYSKWVERIGGEKNAFLRNILRDKKLA